ncbi:hypothetical protein CU098_004667 [Rhizopus stolonifer]|uniref:F-box domain-containing protein n=1 Tax=Rhizopus stolonifer TaxID=4846 RepID=A0A367JN98_RHIST|nr:hypothetical protein CU098_004667 [Rhizopus stolonifer]
MQHLSLELVELIASYCVSPKDKANLCQVNRHYYSAVIHLLYKHIMITSPRQYVLLKNSLCHSKSLSHCVHRLDFSSYTTRGSRWSEERAKSVLLPEELAYLIGCCDLLQELLIGEEMVYAFVSPQVIQAIFNHQKIKLRTLDFTGFCDRNVSSLLAEPQLSNVSFYMCMAFSQDKFFIPFFKEFSSSGNQLKRLDLAYTQINSQLFSYLLQGKQYQALTHLNLQGCHSLSCCSPLIDFIERCENLQHLNLNMDFNGIGASRFCHECIYRLLKSRSTVRLLDMGGHVNVSPAVLTRLMTEKVIFPQLRHLSFAYCQSITLDILEKFLLYNHHAHLGYLNLARTPLTELNGSLVHTMNRLKQFKHLQTVEVSPFTSKKYPSQLLNYWKMTTQGRRTYYSQQGHDPRFVYSKKMILFEDGQMDTLSPMNKYWCYSY